jgi:hypothetical protein
MPKVMIEGNIPGAGELAPNEFREISRLSCRVLSKLEAGGLCTPCAIGIKHPHP